MIVQYIEHFYFALKIVIVNGTSHISPVACSLYASKLKKCFIIKFKGKQQQSQKRFITEKHLYSVPEKPKHEISPLYSALLPI